MFLPAHNGAMTGLLDLMNYRYGEHSAPMFTCARSVSLTISPGMKLPYNSLRQSMTAWADSYLKLGESDLGAVPVPDEMV